MNDISGIRYHAAEMESMSFGVVDVRRRRGKFNRSNGLNFGESGAAFF